MARKRRIRKLGGWKKFREKEAIKKALRAKREEQERIKQAEQRVVAQEWDNILTEADDILQKIPEATKTKKKTKATKKRASKKRTTKKKTTAKKKVEATESIAAPAVQEETVNGLVELEESKPKRRSWFKKVLTDEG